MNLLESIKINEISKFQILFHRKTCCVIQDIYSETRVYTPGSRGRAHPTPDETIPTTITLPLR